MTGDTPPLPLHVVAPPATGRFLALALKRFNRDDFDLWHVAVLYRPEDGSEIRKLDLSGHNELRDWSIDDERSGWPAGYAWTPMLCDELETAELIALCRKVGAKVREPGAQVKLAFPYEGGRFESIRGTLEPVGSEYGLYCSTCVLALFKGIGIELLDRSTWAPTDEMAAQIEWFADQLKPHDLPHAQRILTDRASVVFHPLHIIAACFSGARDVKFPVASFVGSMFKERYDDLYPREPQF